VTYLGCQVNLRILTLIWKRYDPNTGEKKTLENTFSHIPISNASKSRIAIMLLTSGQVSVAISSFVSRCLIKFQLGGMR
jgi:hypothetical protein